MPSTGALEAQQETFGDLNLSILGLGSEYPVNQVGPSIIDEICERHYPHSPAMEKVRRINHHTGIEFRSAIGTIDHPLINGKNAPTIDELSKVFLKDGVELAITASRKALNEANLLPSDITHVVSTTCTNSANPGFDHFVCQGLGITQPVEKVLLHGVGCSGGLAVMRTAANLALGSSFRHKKARILMICLEISSLMVRSELDSVHELQDTRIGICLFSDCASAAIMSNGIGQQTEPVYELLGWDHSVIPDTSEELGFDVHPNGWKVVLTPKVPALTAGIVPPTFDKLMASLPALPPNYQKPADFDWALHPGGATILQGVEQVMSITPEHQRASYDTYMKHGNSSSATIFSVLNRLRQKDMDGHAPNGKVKDFVVSCAFGPGVTIEMVMLKRNLNHVRRVPHFTGVITPPETGSERGGSDIENELESESEDAAFADEIEEAREVTKVEPAVSFAKARSPVSAEPYGPDFLRWPNSAIVTLDGPSFLRWPLA